MNITVTKNQVTVNTDYILNDKEYNVNQCYFSFSDEYTDDLVKKAIFVQGTSTIEMSIINNQCQIPAEVLNNGQFELRVYAYEVDGDELLLRYSPSYTTAYVRTGSYIENAESPEVITPTQFEQYMQAMNDGLNEVANVDIDAEQLDNGMSVTITNRYGEDKTVYAYDGEKGETGATPNIQIGTVETGATSSATITGTPENPVLNLVLEKGEKGETGTTGNGIASFEKTSTSGLIDTYTITFTNGTTSTLNVTNGRGIVSIDLTSTEENIDTYTITYNDGTTSIFTVTNSTVTDQEFKTLEAEVNKYKTLSLLLPKVEGEGSSVTLNNTVEGVTMDITPEGATSQDGTPTPDTPIPIKVVTGEQNVNVKGKNILNYRNITERAKTYGISINDKEEVYDSSPTSDGRSWGYANSTWQMNLEAGTYTITLIFSTQCSNANAGLMIYPSVGGSIAGASGNIKNLATKNLTFTLTERTDIGIVLKIYDGVAKVQLEKSSTPTEYVPYQQQTYPLSLGSIELAKIGDYQDYIYGTPNNWYKYKYIQKVIFDGTEDWVKLVENTNTVQFRVYPELAKYRGLYNVISNLFKTYSGNVEEECITGQSSSTGIQIIINKTRATTVGEFKTWLPTHNVTSYYQLSTPTTEQITDTTLIEQLNNLYNATSQEGTTYITCSSASDDNETLQVKASAYKDISAILNPLVESEG